jgi:hypothetical protein
MTKSKSPPDAPASFDQLMELPLFMVSPCGRECVTARTTSQPRVN